MKNDKKIIITKQKLDWNLVSYFMRMFYGFPAVMKDKGFREIFDQLNKYVSSKINPPYSGDILEEYVLVEQEVTDEVYATWLENNKK
ncbi:MAG: hypothetical protein HDT32_07160 [Clostridiales bacterium]|nr:hypothetical protein [Clostridiales bacterium]